MSTDRPMRAWRRWARVAVPILLLALAAVYYLHRLDKWLAYDDEGGYLYAAWRITLGELPYRDFLTPQLPAFLYPGALLLAASGYSVWAARFVMTLYALGSAALLYGLVRRAWGWGPAVLALALVLVQQESFWAARFFRPEAPMLFWGLLGLYLFGRAYPMGRRWELAAAGAALGLAMMAKLFGALMMAGVGLYILAGGVRTRQWRAMWSRGLWVGVPFLAVVGLIGGVFQAATPHFLAAVLGHHLRQGAGTPLAEVLRKGFELYRNFAKAQPAYLALALMGIWPAWRRRETLGRVFAWQIPTALAFLAMTRELQERHLTYLIPSLAALGGLALFAGGRWLAGWLGRRHRWVGVGAASVAVACALALAAWPHVARNAWVASWEEHDTAQWAAYIQAHTAPGEYVMADYPGLNFYARRPTTPTAAGISRGAAKSGQITGAQLVREMEQYQVRMVLMNVAQGAHQFVLLQDYDVFKAHVQTHFGLLERRVYDYRLIEAYARPDAWQGERRGDDFGHLIALTGLRWERQEAAPGGSLDLMLRFQKTGTAPELADYAVGLRLLDSVGHERGLGSKTLVDIDKDTYWDIKGREQAVLLPTTQWPRAEQTLDLFKLPVNLATPPGEYRVVLRLHSVGGWDGLPHLGADGRPAGYDVELGMARVLPAATPPDVAALPMQSHVDVDIAPGLRLEGATLPSDPVRPGDRLTASIFWSATGASRAELRLRLALECDGRAWGEVTAPLAGEEYPTIAWRPDEVLLGLYDVPVDAHAPSGDYRLIASVSAGDKVVGQHDVGTVAVAGRERVFDAPTPQASSGAQWGGAMTLLGYDLSAEGRAARLTLYWRADERMGASYTVFVHLLGADGRIAGQSDRVPVGGGYPTSAWLPGEVVADSDLVPLKAEAPDGAYTVAVGLYDAQTGLRLPVSDAQGQPQADDRLILSAVTLGATK